MTVIPDTGPGLSGFLAHYLWLVYAHFPSTGRWDWLLLFLALGAAVHSAFLPNLWKAVEADMAALREKKTNYSPTILGWPIFFCGISLSFLTWFFDTPAGRTFLTDRQLFGVMLMTKAPTKLDWALGVPVFAIMLLDTFILVKVSIREKAAGLNGPRPFPSRNFVNLYAGGGVFEDNALAGLHNIPTLVVLVYMSMWGIGRIFVIWGAAQWGHRPPVAPIILLFCFIYSAYIMQMFRMLFVYILHKRTFG